ncbi:MAG: hypothetical protein A3K83_07555 [Omnitrophica WOR_2 bacterium RBG_13_44_8b]|nr:MAG: hypothetical protein A3K83_07555 [Omnitrophica WOR_2 bacterium RBG_13_44_8b]
MEGGEKNFLIKIDELKKLGAVNFEFSGKNSILLYNGGQIRAFENICTHKGGPSKLLDNKLVCEWHGAIFDPLTGEALGRPAPQGSRLKEIKLAIRNGNIYAVPTV